MRHLEINLSKQALKDAMETQWRNMKLVRDNEDVVISFDTQHLKSSEEETIPVALEIYEYQEVRLAQNGQN